MDGWEGQRASASQCQRMKLSRAHGALFDALLMLALDDPVHVDARRVNKIGIERPGGHDFLDLGDADLAAGRGQRIRICAV